MTSWIVLIAVIALFAAAVRYGKTADPPVPAGYDGERQLAELRAISSITNTRLP